MVTVSVTRGKALKLFATPVIMDELRGAEALNAELEQLILAHQAKVPGYQRSNRGGWQSPHDFPKWGGAPGQTLIRNALALAGDYTAGPSKAAVGWRFDAWANVNESGDFNMPHVHSASFWSVIYFVRVGDGEGGQLVLHDPRMPGLRMHAPHLRFNGVGQEDRVEIEPKPGLMVLIPAWLLHSVEPWRGSGKRISVAMNIRAK